MNLNLLPHCVFPAHSLSMYSTQAEHMLTSHLFHWSKRVRSILARKKNWHVVMSTATTGWVTPPYAHFINLHMKADAIGAPWNADHLSTGWITQVYHDHAQSRVLVPRHWSQQAEKHHRVRHWMNHMIQGLAWTNPVHNHMAMFGILCTKMHRRKHI